MPTRYGKCINIGNGCNVADSKQIIEVPDGADFVCLDCDSDLVEVPKKEKPKFPWLIVSIIGGVIILFVIGFFLYRGYQTKKRDKFVADSLKMAAATKAKNDSLADVQQQKMNEAMMASQIQRKKDSLAALGHPDSAAIKPPPPVDNSKKPDVTPKRPTVRDNSASEAPTDVNLNNIEACFHAIANRNVSYAEKARLKAGILGLFSSPDAEVVRMNKAIEVRTGITIQKYIESIDITHRIVTVVDKKITDGKIYQLLVSEK